MNCKLDLLLATILVSALCGGSVRAADPGATAVRSGDHAGFGRLVFDLPRGATFEAMGEDDRLLLVFQGAGTIEAPAKLPHNVIGLEVGDDTATVRMVRGTRERSWRLGDRLVVDVLDTDAAPPKSDPRQADRPIRPLIQDKGGVQDKGRAGRRDNSGDAAGGDGPTKGENAGPGRGGEGLQAREGGDRSAPAALPPVRLPSELAASRGSSGSGSLRLPIVDAAPIVPVATQTVVGGDREGRGAADAQGLLVPPAPALSPLAASFLLKVDRDVGAAAFRRGEFGVIVLDRRLALAAPEAIEGSRAVLGAVATTILVPLPPDQSLSARPAGGGWLVSFVRDAPAATLQPQPGPEGASFAMPRPGRAVTALDPLSGGTLLVGASLAADAESALASGRQTPDFALLPSFLGVAVESLSDRIDLRSTPTGFVLTGSPSAPLAAPAGSGRRFDLPDEPAASLVNRLHGQLASAALAEPRARSRDRLAAAQTMVALGLGIEAQSLVKVVAADDPQAAADAQVAALGGVAAVMAGRLEEANGLDDPRLDDPKLPGHDEVMLWRGVRDRRRGQVTPTSLGLASLAPLARAYPATLRRLIWPDVVEAAVEAGVAIPAGTLSAFAKAESLEHEGRVDEALAAYRAIEAGPDRLDQVRAGARAAELALAAGKIGPGEAADAFEGLTFAWRGDGREAALRMRMAELRAASGAWRPALDAFRLLEKLFPEQAATAQAKKVAVFEAMLTAEGSGLSPLEVVLLAAEHADCVPAGPPGAKLAALLSDKLMALDLPARAIPLLQGLVRGAPAGAARAEFGARLAQMLLEGGNSSDALAALQASGAAALPDDLAERRGLLTARAQAVVGDLSGAVAGLLELATPAADDLRAKLLADHGDWRGSLDALADLSAKVVPAEGAIPEQAQDVLMRRASAAVQVADFETLRRLGGYVPRMSEARADLLRVLTAAPIGVPGDLPRAGKELLLVRGIPERLQTVGGK